MYKKTLIFFIALWLLLVLTTIIGFVVLDSMSRNRIDTAQIIVKNKIAPDTYIAKLYFDSHIFRNQSNVSTITLIQAHTSYQITDIRLHKDSANYLEFQSKQALSNEQNIGKISFSTNFIFLWDILPRLMIVFIFGVGIWWLCVPLKKILANIDTTYPKIPTTHTPQKPISYVLLFSICALILVLFVFQFSLGFPGYHVLGDTYTSITLFKNNGHPVFIAYVLQLLYALFGKHLYFLFLANLIPFYVGLAFLVCGLYLHFRSIWAILSISIIFVGNIYFQNFIQYHSFTLPMLLFCGYCMLLFSILVPISSRFWRCCMYIGIAVVFFFALLWRHNAIVSVFPASFIIIYAYLSRYQLPKRDFVRFFTRGVFIFGILSVCIVSLFPRLLSRGDSFPANHIFLHQMAGTCVPSDDWSCFKQEWYYPHKGWEDIKALYEKYPLNADPFNVFWWPNHDELPIPHGKIDGLYTNWIRSILKHPLDFAKHQWRFVESMWFATPDWIFSSAQLQNKPTDPWHKEVVSLFPENERSVTLTPQQEKIYNFLYNHRIVLNHFYGVVLSACILLLSLALVLYKPHLCNSLLVFSLSVSFAGFISAIVIVLFTPVPETRYMSVILPLSLIATIGLIAFALKVLRLHSSFPTPEENLAFS